MRQPRGAGQGQITLFVDHIIDAHLANDWGALWQFFQKWIDNRFNRLDNRNYVLIRLA